MECPSQIGICFGAWVASIQERRGEAGGRVVTIRESDLMPLALLYRTSPEGFAGKLEEWGLATEAEPA